MENFHFLLGLALLIWGALVVQAPDWDIPICLIMAIPTYLTAPLSLRIILERRWQLSPIALLSAWFSVDGFYWIYWHFKSPFALHAMRWANFPASLALYGLCGMLWLFHGSLREFFHEITLRLRKNIKIQSK